jgi:hypothetical protein
MKSGLTEVDINTPPRGPMFRTYLHGIEPLVNNQSTTTASNPVAMNSAEISGVSMSDDRMYQVKFCGEFEDYLKCALVQPGDEETRNVLQYLGIDHWSSFYEDKTLTPEFLVGQGIPFGTASKLVRTGSRFAIRVSGDIEKGGFTPIMG